MVDYRLGKGHICVYLCVFVCMGVWVCMRVALLWSNIENLQ